MSNLFLGNRSFAELQVHSQTTHCKQYQRLLKQAATYHDWLPAGEHPDKSITFIGMAAANLALAYRLSGQSEFLETLQKWLGVAIAYPNWGKNRMPDHDLDAAWLLFGLSLAYNWVGEELPAEDRKALKGKLFLQGQRLYDYAIETEGRWWRSAYWQNHNWICFAGLAAAAYSLQTELPETVQWSQLAFDNFKTVFSVLPEDGSDSEGVVYWCYGVLWLLIYADLAAQNEGINFYDTPFLKNTFFYRLYMSGPNLVDTANFGDCHDRRSAHSRAMVYWFARHHHNGYAQWLAGYFEQTGEWEREGKEGLLLPGLFPQTFLDFLWFDPAVESQTITNLPLSRSFSDLGLVGTRTSWDADAVVLAFKSSVPLGLKAWSLAHDLINNHNWDAVSGGHLHPDENSFILIRGSDYLAVDEGYSKAKQTIQHNTILVDGCGQYHEGVYHIAKGLGAEWGGQLKSTFHSQGIHYICGEAAGAYAPESGLSRFTRQMILWNGNLVLLFDDLVADGLHQFEWLLQTDALAKQVDDKRFTVITGDSRLGINIVAPKEMMAKNTEQEVVAIPSSAEPDHVLRRRQHTLSVSPVEKVRATHFFAVLNMGAKGDAAAHVESLDCAGGYAAKIVRNNKNIVAGFTATGYVWEAEGVFQTDSSWLIFESDQNDEIIKLFVGEATRTYLRGHLWCVASKPVCFAYHTDEWTIQSSAPAWVSLKISAERSAVFDGKTYKRDHLNGMVRIYVPAGESTIILKSK